MAVNKDNLGDRIKRYESVSKPLLTRRSPVMVRVDGKAFHTFTKGFKKPFDDDVIGAMVYATKMTAQHMQGFELAYTQSDEATFMLWDFRSIESGAWFDYEVNKLVSITASYFTYYFNQKWQEVYRNKYAHTPDDKWNAEKARRMAIFDARAFNVPYDDWPNVFIWRQRDWERNSVQMMARSLYSQSELHGKNVDQLNKLIREKALDWNNLDSVYKYGSFIDQDYNSHNIRVNYEFLKASEAWDADI